MIVVAAFINKQHNKAPKPVACNPTLVKRKAAQQKMLRGLSMFIEYSIRLRFFALCRHQHMSGFAENSVHDEPDDHHQHIAQRQAEKERNGSAVSIAAAEARDRDLGHPTQKNREPHLVHRVGQRN